MSEESWIDRVKLELEELEHKLGALTAFIGTEKFDALTEDRRQALERQHIAMGSYRRALADRIAIEEAADG